MSLFGLDADAVRERIAVKGASARVPSLARSLLVGSLGFGAVGFAAFSVWAFGGRWLYLRAGEGGLYVACALVFIGLSGLLLHTLVIGPGALWRFYGLFSASFGVYAIAWCAGWFLLRGKLGEWMGSLAGTAVLALILAAEFSGARQWLSSFLVLFLAHSAGYFVGEFFYECLSHQPSTEVFGYFLDKSKLVKIGMLLWGISYGFGFGLGLGYVLYAVQSPIRKRLQE